MMVDNKEVLAHKSPFETLVVVICCGITIAVGRFFLQHIIIIRRVPVKMARAATLRMTISTIAPVLKSELAVFVYDE